MGRVPKGPSLIPLVQEGRQKKHGAKRKACRVWGVTLKKRGLLSNTYLWWRHWLMDWAHSAAPPDEKASAAHTRVPKPSSHAHRNTHAVGRTEDETTLCQHMALSAMLMKFIWIHVDTHRRGKGKMKRWREGKKRSQTTREVMAVM